MVSSRPEPEWDDDSRAEMLALAEYEREICDCGLHVSLTSDPSNLFTFKTRVCPVCAAQARWQRKVKADDDAARPGPQEPAETAHPDDGRKMWLAGTTADELAAARAARRSPAAPPG